jgi:2-polyprenyl-3-methyl-5-hydroxy-6-metoxy-1,4-benzoquinol methylase
MRKYFLDMLTKNIKYWLRKLILSLLLIANIFTRFIPNSLYHYILKFMILLKAYSNNQKKDLIFLFRNKDEVEKIINNRALFYGGGEHPKHYLTNYHQFFINNIIDGESVLDIGCGYGAVSRSIAKSRPKSKILGIDNDQTRMKQAQVSDNPSNLSFIYGDVTQYNFSEEWDVIVLSNVLEHIESRVEFLLAVKLNTKAKKFLIRVPCYERDWQVPLRDIFGINYFTDNDHKIEHKIIEFRNEMHLAQLEIAEIITIWGEIWSVCSPVSK